MHSVVAGFQECSSEAIQRKFGDMKTGDEIHIPVGSQKNLGVVLWALASHSGSIGARLADFRLSSLAIDALSWHVNLKGFRSFPSFPVWIPLQTYEPKPQTLQFNYAHLQTSTEIVW